MMGRFKKFPLVITRECCFCKRIFARYIKDSQQNRKKDYCSLSCMKHWKKKTTGDARKASSLKVQGMEGRRDPATVKGPTAFERELWR